MNPNWRDPFHPFRSAVNAGMNPYMKYPGPGPHDNGYNNLHDLNQQQHSTINTQSYSGRDRPGTSFQNKQCAEPTPDEDVNGDTNESEEEEPKNEDPELARKRKELKEIEKQIMRKKASLAHKTVSVQKPRREPFSEEPKSAKSNKTLRERVKHLLQVRNRVIRTNGSLLTFRRHTFKAVQDHPLKFRVVIAQQQRFENPTEESRICKIMPLPKTSLPRQKEVLLEDEEMNTANQGFMCFLKLLNKGVDIDKLKEFVNDETDGMPHDRATSSIKSPVKVSEKLWKNDGFMKTQNKRMDCDKVTDMVNTKTDDRTHRSQTDRASSHKTSGMVRERLWEKDSFFHKLNKGLDNVKSTKIVNHEKDGRPHRSRRDRVISSVTPSIKVREEFPNTHCKLDYNDEIKAKVNDKLGVMPLNIKISFQNDCTTRSAERKVIVKEKLLENYSFLKTRNKELDCDGPKETVYNETKDLQHGSQTLCRSSQNGAQTEKRPEYYSVFNKLIKGVLDDEQTEIVNENTGDKPLSRKLSPQSDRAASSIKQPVVTKEKIQEVKSILKKPKSRVSDYKPTQIIDDYPHDLANRSETDHTSSVRLPGLVTENLREDYSFLRGYSKQFDNDESMERVNNKTDSMPQLSQIDHAISPIKVGKKLPDEDMPLSRKNCTEPDHATGSVKPPVVAIERTQEEYSFLNTYSKVLDNDKPMERVNDEADSIPQCSQTELATNAVKPPVIVREKLPEEEQRPSVDDAQKHLLNVLETLGMSLDTDEITRLNDRTQERLYGKKTSTKTKNTESADVSEEKAHFEEPQQEKEMKNFPVSHKRSSSGSQSQIPPQSTKTAESVDASGDKTQSFEPRWKKKRKNKKKSRNTVWQSLYPPRPLNPHLPPTMNPSNAYCYPLSTAYQNDLMYDQAPVPEPSHFSNQNSGNFTINRCLLTLVDAESSEINQSTSPLPNPNLPPAGLNYNWDGDDTRTPVPEPSNFSNQNSGNFTINRCLLTLVDAESSKINQATSPLLNPNLPPAGLNYNWVDNNRTSKMLRLWPLKIRKLIKSGQLKIPDP